MDIKYTFSRIIVVGKSYTSDCIIHKGEVIPKWQREKGHLLKPRDIKDSLKKKPILWLLEPATAE